MELESKGYYIFKDHVTLPTTQSCSKTKNNQTALNRLITSELYQEEFCTHAASDKHLT